jgi:hypothetical protein
VWIPFALNDFGIMSHGNMMYTFVKMEWLLRSAETEARSQPAQQQDLLSWTWTSTWSRIGEHVYVL